MPIRQEFESGQLDLSFVVMDFLRSNSDSAYSVNELVAELAAKGMSLTVEEVQNVMLLLEKQEKVEAKTVGGMVYYIYRKPRLGFRI